LLAALLGRFIIRSFSDLIYNVFESQRVSGAPRLESGGEIKSKFDADEQDFRLYLY